MPKKDKKKTGPKPTSNVVAREEEEESTLATTIANQVDDSTVTPQADASEEDQVPQCKLPVIPVPSSEKIPTRSRWYTKGERKHIPSCV
jgi:hypothetical protein